MSERSYTYYGVLIPGRVPEEPVGLIRTWIDRGGTQREETFMRSLDWKALHGRSWLFPDDSDRTRVEIDESAAQRFIEEVAEIVKAEGAPLQKHMPIDPE